MLRSSLYRRVKLDGVLLSPCRQVQISSTQKRGHLEKKGSQTEKRQCCVSLAVSFCLTSTSAAATSRLRKFTSAFLWGSLVSSASPVCFFYFLSSPVLMMWEHEAAGPCTNDTPQTWGLIQKPDNADSPRTPARSLCLLRALLPLVSLFTGCMEFALYFLLLNFIAIGPLLLLYHFYLLWWSPVTELKLDWCFAV